jgi:hypothetical protein
MNLRKKEKRKWSNYLLAQDLVTATWSRGFWPIGARSSQFLCPSFLFVRDGKSVRMRARRESHHNFVRGQNTFTDNNYYK